MDILLSKFAPSLFGTIQTLLGTVLLAETQSNSPIRWLCFPFIAALTYFQVITGPNFSTAFMWNVAVGGAGFLLFLHLLNLLFITSIDLFPAQSDLENEKTTRNPNPMSRIERYQHAVRYIINFRGVGTKYQISKLPPFPVPYNSAPWPRAYFLLRQTAIIAWQCLLLDLIAVAMHQLTQTDRDYYFGNGMEFRLLTLSGKQLLARIFGVFVPCLLLLRVALDSSTRLCAVPLVLSGATAIDEWPPVFGSLRDAYTLRHFWGTSWHQFLRWPLTSCCTFVTLSLLGLSRPSLLERYTHLTLVFMLSGILHVVYYIASGITGGSSGAMLCFTSNAFGVVFEDAIIYCWRRALPGVETQRLAKCVGYIWVISYLCCTMAWWFYPALRLTPDAFAIVPSSGIADKVGVIGGWCIATIAGLALKVVFKADV
ncbi:hypothetical protein MW887_004386 [Aspergillus wentii]|nr:hypothetical protein MW887_004386 [Aspergillus wentii]